MTKRSIGVLAVMGLIGLLVWVFQGPIPDSAGERAVWEKGNPESGFSRPSPSASHRDGAKEAGLPSVPDLQTGSGKEIRGETILMFPNEEGYRRFLSSVPRDRLLGSLDRFRAVRVRDGDWLGSSELAQQAIQAPNYYVEAPRVPLDFREKGEALYEGVGANALEMMGAAEATGDWGKSVSVAVLDTGFAGSPVELMAEGHGTAIASLIAGRSRPARGAAPGADLLDFPVLGQGGVGDAFSLAGAILKAVDWGARVINMSLGSPGDSAVVREAVAYAVSKNVALVAAVGNDSVNRVNYPAAYDGVVAVAAVDASRQQLYFSNRGSQVDVAAPGYGVVAAWPGQTYVEMSGTSGSTALVSGAIAALLSREPGLTGTQAARLIVDYADDTGAPGRDEETGGGLVNLRRVWERHQRGIVDVAVGGVTLREEGGVGRITATVQNRGTETVNSPSLEITAGDVRRKFYFGSLAPGQIRAESVTFDLGRARSAGGIPAGAAANVRGDQRSGNDLWTGYFRISKEK